MKTVEAFKDYMQKLFVSIVGRPVRIVEITSGDDLGFTSEKGDIHLNFSHQLLQDLKETTRDMFMIGVFAHEMLHQILTDFKALDKALIGLTDPRERKIAGLFANLLEDPTIEYRASKVIGGVLLQALRFTIRVIYKASEPIDGSDSPFSELCNALIQFGDLGLIKGHFTSEEAFEDFRMIAPEFNSLIPESTPEERISASLKWTELTRPLWEQLDTEKITDSIKKENGISDFQGREEASEDISDSDGYPEKGEKTPEECRRDDFAKLLDNSAKNGEQAGRPEDIEVKAETSESDAEARNELSAEPGSGIGALFADKDTADRMIFDELKLSPEDFIKASEEVEKAQSKKIKEEPYITDLDIPVTSRIVKGALCINHRLMTNSTDTRTKYAEELRKNESYIRVLIKQFSALFTHEEDEVTRATSGELNLKRYSTAVSANVFDKRRESEQMDDVSILVCIDESGSMNAEGKIDMARKTALILAEVCHALHIPLYIMAYTADSEGKDIVHDHFITWSNTKTERYSLMSLKAKVNNCDGYSIRYASMLLKQHKSDHKIMFVLSDGIPACRKYPSTKAGLSDTAEAIREAKRISTVIGLGLGADCNPSILKQIYQGSFVFVREPEHLTKQLVGVLKELIKNY